jgi:hypothetical protein
MADMWTATKITADAADKMQANAGLLLKSFNISAPVEPADTDIICDTTGDITISCKPDTQDFFDDVNNAPKNTKEGKRITGWTNTFAFTALSNTEDTIKLGLGAAEVGSDGGISPRRQYKLTDFKTYYWIGDMFDEDKLLCVKIDNAVSTEGITLTTTNQGKGTISVTLTGHVSTSNLNSQSMTFYLLTKVGEYDSTKTYALNDLCTHNSTLYKCTTAITTAEEWNAEHWTAVTNS